MFRILEGSPHHFAVHQTQRRRVACTSRSEHLQNELACGPEASRTTLVIKDPPHLPTVSSETLAALRNTGEAHQVFPRASWLPLARRTRVDSEIDRRNSPPYQYSTLEEEAPVDATVSLAFSPSLRVDGLLPDSIIVSSNHVYFYVHRHRILNISSNAFLGQFLHEDLFPTASLSSVHLPEDGDVANVLLHTMYGFPCIHFHPTLETIDQSLTALIKYGVLIEAHTTPHQPLYQLILSHAPHRPIETYALAAHHDLEDLAVAISGHLLSYDTSSLTDALAAKIGPVYLKRLFLLHQSRLAALRNIVLQPPAFHPSTPGCTDGDQGELVRAWALAAARLVWDATPSEASTVLSNLIAFEAAHTQRRGAS
ncbi:hypothetical protein LXA43DRAFT_987267 [Ganoderma leucocontextum]|nr:hypothetical protein LXA43DRAFT_987267 [Ganoderma leucocontextum]